MIVIEKGKKYLVTGGSGFLGIPLVHYILSHGALVRVIARDEGKLVELKEKFPSVEIYTGDISDTFEVRQAMNGVSGVFHLAASKHVGLAETFVRENVKTNTIANAISEGLLDPVKVTRTALENAASVAGTILTTESVVFEKRDDKKKDEGFDMSGLGM
jgi:uncharacterized protein YbjT (DUF2867 family)